MGVRESDSRRQFVCRALAAVIASPSQQDECYQYLLGDDSGPISNFLDDAGIMTLQASVNGLDTGQLKIRLSNANDFPEQCEFQVVVSKLKRGPIEQQDLPANIHISTVSSSPLASLYHSIHDVYSPLLLGEDNGKRNKVAMDQRLQDLLEQLQIGLGTAVRLKQQGSSLVSGNDDINSMPLHAIIGPLDELNFWMELAGSQGVSGMALRSAQLISSAMEGLRGNFTQLEQGGACTWDQLLEVADVVVQALRQAWPVKWTNGWAYGQPRVCHFLKVVGVAFVAYIQKRLRAYNLWTAPVAQLRTEFEGVLQLLQHWQEESKALTQYWSMGADSAGHQWAGEPYADPYIRALHTRVDEIYQIRSTHDELARLITVADGSSSADAKIFAAFSSVDPLQVNDFTQPLWRAAVREYEQQMGPVEHNVTQKLRELISTVLIPSLTAAATNQGNASLVAHPHQLLQHLNRYRSLLSRNSVGVALSQEKETLAKLVERMLDGYQQELDQHRKSADRLQNGRRGGGAEGSAMGLADVIAWAVQAHSKTSSLLAAVQLLSSGAGAAAAGGHESSTLAAVVAVAADLQQELAAFKTEVFTGWQDQVKDALTDMSQWKHGKLMTCDSQNAHIRTYFNDQLVLLIREVRQLQTLGFSIKKDIMAEVETAQRFYRYGMVLKQHANFYNNISTEMVPCQKPMMLKDAIDFEKVLMNPKDAQGKEITWRSASALDGYVKRLNTVADQLAQKNRQLRKWHQVVGEKVVALMGTDLVRAKEKWVQGVRELRELFQHLEAQGFSADSQKVWRQHWDFQLYKALEYQYSLGLEAINKTLPEMEIKMVFRQHRLQYEPALEDLRIRHYKDCINTFLGLPLKMKGLSDLSDRAGFFRAIAEACPSGIARVYSAVEALFVQLAEELKKYQDWVVLGTVDLDEFVDQQLEEVTDWELNFKMLKAVAREAERLPNEVTIDCYRIVMLPVKQTVDEHMKRLQEALVASLRRKAVGEKQAVEEFMKRAAEMLEEDAGSVEALGLARQRATQLVQELPNMMQVRRRIDDKNKLLRQMAGSGQAAQFAMVDMTDVNNAWDAFTSQLHQFDAHLEERKVHLQAQINQQVEEFKSTVVGFFSRWQELKPKGAPSGNASVVLTRLDEYSHQVEELQQQALQYQRDCEAFKMEPPEFEVLREAVADIEATKVAWAKYAEFLKERDELANKDWLSVRDQVWKVEDFLVKWGKATDGTKGKADSVALILLHEIEVYRRCVPYLKLLRGAGWEDAHWAQLFTLLGLKASGPGAVSRETVTLAHFLDKAEQLIANAEKIKTLDAQAQAESVLRKALSELKMWSLQKEFELSEVTVEAGGKQRKVALIKEWKEVLTEVGDHQSLVASLKQSPYHHIFKEEVLSWENKLAWLQEGLGLLNQIQRKWLYLQPIFARGALPQQQARFRGVDDDFKRIMQHLEMDCKVVAFTEVSGLREKLPQMVGVLEGCQRALSDFLEEKRSLFPRFYFLGDDDLLEILGQAKNPQVIQSHLKKLFGGIHKVHFSPDQSSIIKMCSMEGETVRLGTPVQITEAIEIWLAHLAAEMKKTLAQELVAIAADPAKSESSQIMCLLEAVRFTKGVEDALVSSSLQGFRSTVVRRLEEIVNSDYTGQLLLKLRQQALVVDFIHYRDIVELLIAQKASSKADWNWTRQLRYYHKQGGAAEVIMAEARMDYSWEYQGNAPRLVYTPLTDKCYLTLTQGMALGYGGNPYGPAGTGKTESVKALGQALARQVLVFNCDEEFDFKSMGRIFVGLVQCGAWGCFDEFNRLDEEVLSAVSQQIQIIQTALKEGVKKLEFMDKVIDVDRNAGIFVTLNPAGKGYGGRSKLPDNLKQLFRSVAMTVPDNDLIAEVLLLAEGFGAARQLGGKLVSLFSLARQLLSSQQHYDWGLRALKTCLSTAGKELRKAKDGAAGPLLEQEQAGILIRAVCSIKLPSLIYEDNSRFLALLGDLFPGITVSGSQDASLEEAIQKVAAEMKMSLTTAQVEKMLQLHLACEQRIGIILVGPSGSGKSLLWQVLERAYEVQGRKPVVYKVNPKALPRQHLLGQMNMDTREWTDGVLTAAARKVQKEPLEQRSWIVCDGDVDPEWIESLNSVLDDNRLLTMPNGERIQFANNINFIFECHSLEYASPATVSRCGMIFLSDENLELERIVQHWLSTQAVDASGQMASWFKEMFYKAFSWACSRPTVLETTKVGLLHNALSHILGATSKREFAEALSLGLGATMAPDARGAFLSHLVQVSGCSADALQGARDGDPLAALEEAVQDEVQGGDTLVLTEEVRHTLAVLAPWLKGMEPFLLVGPEGCGKSTILEYCLRRLKDVQVATVSCSAQTTAANVIQKLVQMCGKPVTTTTGKVLRADTGRIVLYLKDINLPQPDKYGTIQLIAFLQQLLTYGGYYDDNLEFIRLDRVQIVGSMTPSSTVGRHPLSTRFSARVRVASVDYPSPQQLHTILCSTIKTQLAGCEDPSWTGAQNCGSLAKAMLDVYTQVLQSFPQNDHWHYQFTPRDLSAWVRGLRAYSLHGVSLLEAALHEGCRIFRDRLVGPEAAASFSQLLQGVFRGQLSFKGEAGGVLYSTLGASAEDRLSRDPTKLRLVRWEAEDFTELVADKLKTFEREVRELRILLFPEALERIARVDRVLAQPGGSLLLVGTSGTGRRSTVALVAFMHHMEFFTPRMGANYDIKSFRSDLKDVLRKAGLEGRQVCLFLEDHQLEDPAALQAVNSLLSGGEVPGLFTNEELAKELPALEARRAQDMSAPTAGGLFAYFVQCVQRNLHIVVSMDPRSEHYRVRCDANPALFTRCSIQWLQGWGDHGMDYVAASRLKEVQQEMGSCSGADIISQLKHIHKSSSAEHAPRQYLSCVESFTRILAMKYKQLQDQQKFLQGGLDKLAEAATTVDVLSRDADRQRTLLKTKQVEAEEALTRITASMEQAADRRKEVEVLRARLAEEEVELNSRRGGVEGELASVQPLIDMARKAVGGIKPDHINEIRSLKMPPDAIRDVLEGVLQLMGQEDTSWNNMKKFLGQKAVKDDIVNFDAHRITPDIRAKVERLLQAKGQSFEQAVIYRVSVAAAPMAAWVKANVAYSKVLDKVAPLERELDTLIASLTSSQQRLQQCQEELAELDGAVVRLKADFQRKTSEAESLKIGLQRAEETLRSASSLLHKLAGEKERWSVQVKSLGVELVALPSHVLLTAAFITYLPSLPEDSRSSRQEEWQQLVGVQGFDVCRFMSSESEMLTWKAEGLPSDGLSLQNAVVIMNSTLTPLIVDPSVQAATWLKAHLKAVGATLDITTLHDARFTTTLELAVRFGKTLIITEVDGVEPILFPLLRMDLERQGPRSSVYIGDKAVDFNDTFRLFLFTRNPNPRLPPDARSLLTVTNFTVTRSGLEGQLLGLTLQQEQPELEAQKSALLQQEEQLKVQLAAVEKHLLHTLANSQGNILENKELLTSLNDAKTKSATIAASLQDSSALAASLDQQRDAYRPVAQRGSVMFFLLQDLKAVNPMYRFSLSMFLSLFRRALAHPSPPGPLASRLAHLAATLLDLLLASITRSLFNADRLTFAMHLAHCLQPALFPADEWEFFLGRLPSTTASAPPKPSWVREDTAAAYAQLASSFPALVAGAELQDAGTWAPWVASPAVDAPLPGKLGGRVPPFQQLLLVKAFRPDRLQSAMLAFIAQALATRAVGGQPSSIKHLVEAESSPEEPILFITTPGADPTQELAEYARAKVGRGRYHEVAMGQGQAPLALQLLRDCAKSGEWLCLKNCHLVVGWLGQLEKEVFALQRHADFRLFLTSEPNSKFPASLLEACLKVTFEAPPGVKRNLQRTYDAWSAEYLQAGTPLRAQLLFVAAWFHAVVQERRTYIPQGWTQFYEFSAADLRSAADVIQLSTRDGAAPQWQYLRGLLEMAIYGGRIDNPYDVQVLRTYLDQFFCPEQLGGGGGSKALPLAGTRILPPGSSHPEDHLAAISKLPDTDSPALFGLPANIDKVVQQAGADRVVRLLRQMSLSQDAVAGFNRQQWAAQLGPLLRLWETLLTQFPASKQALQERRESQSDAAAPVDNFVALQRTFGRTLVAQVDQQLAALSRVLRGADTLTSEVQVTAAALLADAVPASWEAVWEGPQTPQEYCRALVGRAAAVEQWHQRCQAGSLLTGELDLSHLFQPATFLNALRQQTARALGVPMDGLKLATCWNGHRLQGSSPLIAQLGGLLVQGAQFDGVKLVPVEQDSPVSKEVPPMHLAWIPLAKALPYATYLTAPLHAALDRSRPLADIQLPIAGPEEVPRWVLSGVAVFCSQ